MRADDPAVEQLMEFYAAGRKQKDFEAGIQQGVARLLADPQFLYRMEADRPDLADGSI
jgi:hypothetical protein